MKEWKPSRAAQAVAAERALLHDLGVIDDPFAAAMLGGGIRTVYAGCRRLPRRTWIRAVTLAGLAGRVRWFDREVAGSLDDGVTQVVTVGAGYDSRPWRFARDGVRCFEIDHPATQMDKRRRAPDRTSVEYVAADLIDDDVAEQLRGSSFDPDLPTVFVIEGVTMYLDEAVVRRQLGSLASVAAPGSCLAVDFFPASRPTAGTHRRQLLLQQVARVGSSEGFRLGVDLDDAAGLVSGCGWTTTSVVPARDAATDLVPSGCGLPLTSVSSSKTYVAAGYQ